MKYLNKIPVEVGNFVCLFNQEEMLPNFETRIWPIFANDNTIKHGRGEDKNFVFYQFKIVTLGGTEYLFGRLIRNMVLVSDQTYEKGKGIKKRKRSMKDSPTTIIIVRLIDHKMVLLKETSRAPGLNTVEKYIRLALAYHRKELRERELTRFKKRKKKQKLRKEEKAAFASWFEINFPIANFRLTPIASVESISKVFKDIKYLTSLSVTLLHTNNEDPKFRSNFVKALKASKDSVGHGATSTIKGQIHDKDAGIRLPQAREIARDVAISKGNAVLSGDAINKDDIDVVIKDNQISIKDILEVVDSTSDELKLNGGIEKLEEHAGPVEDNDVEMKRAVLKIILENMKK